MKCASVGRALPLYVGRDLDARKSEEIAAHLAQCEHCREDEAGLRESRAWVESAPPPSIDESDLAAIRRGVWRQIQAASSVPAGNPYRAGRLILAGRLLAAVMLAVLLSVRPRSEVFRPGPRRAASALTVPAPKSIQAA